MFTHVWKCRSCGHREETYGSPTQESAAPVHCGAYMVRDYRAESATATFKGGGWARTGK